MFLSILIVSVGAICPLIFSKEIIDIADLNLLFYYLNVIIQTVFHGLAILFYANAGCYFSHRLSQNRNSSDFADIQASQRKTSSIKSARETKNLTEAGSVRKFRSRIIVFFVLTVIILTVRGLIYVTFTLANVFVNKSPVDSALIRRIDMASSIIFYASEITLVILLVISIKTTILAHKRGKLYNLVQIRSVR